MFAQTLETMVLEHAMLCQFYRGARKIVKVKNYILSAVESNSLWFVHLLLSERYFSYIIFHYHNPRNEIFVIMKAV